MKLNTHTHTKWALLISSIACIALLSACAAPTSQTDSPAPEREFTTGSNLPIRDKSRRADTVSKDAIQNAVQGQGTVTKTGSGG